jgi:hypothetical protein
LLKNLVVDLSGLKTMINRIYKITESSEYLGVTNLTEFEKEERNEQI